MDFGDKPIRVYDAEAAMGSLGLSAPAKFRANREALPESPSKGILLAMEKRKPHYRLADIQGNVRTVGIASFTLTARRNGLAMGLTTEEMVNIVCALSYEDFYKSMTTNEDSRLWQDVYHATLSTGKMAYIKVTGFADGRAPIIQFKEK